MSASWIIPTSFAPSPIPRVVLPVPSLTSLVICAAKRDSSLRKYTRQGQASSLLETRNNNIHQIASITSMFPCLCTQNRVELEDLCRKMTVNILTKAFCLGETRQHITDEHVVANLSNFPFSPSSNACMRALPSIIKANTMSLPFLSKSTCCCPIISCCAILSLDTCE